MEFCHSLETEYQNIFIDFGKKHSVDGQALDKDFFEYVCDSVSAELDINSEEVHSIISSFYPDYSIDGEDINLIIRAAQVLQRKRAGSVQDNPAADKPPDLAFPVSEEQYDSGGDDVAIYTEKDFEDISYICSIFPNIDISVIEYVYMLQCAKNKDPSVLYLVENCSDDLGIARITEKMNVMKQKEAEEQERERLEAKQRQAALFKIYGDRPVKIGDSAMKSAKKNEKVSLVLENPVDKSSGGKQKIRYRDNQVVTHKGEKVIVLKNPADDYDGGSRGKVKTKGKRGPGWV